MNSQDPSETMQQKQSKKRYNIFKNQLFQPQFTFKKVPLHFKFSQKPKIVLDHTIDLTNEGQSKDHSRVRRPQSRTKIFQRRKCQSLKSGLLSSNGIQEQNKTTSSNERIRKGNIFRESNTVTVREEQSVSVQENMRQLIGFTNQEERQNRKPDEKKIKKLKFTQQLVFTPDEFRMFKGKATKRDKITKKNDPMQPSQFCTLLMNVSRTKRAKKRTQIQHSYQTPFTMPMTPQSFNTAGENYMDRQNWIYRI